jgi:hypothetical protein
VSSVPRFSYSLFFSANNMGTCCSRPDPTTDQSPNNDLLQTLDQKFDHLKESIDRFQGVLDCPQGVRGSRRRAVIDGNPTDNSNSFNSQRPCTPRAPSVSGLSSIEHSENLSPASDEERSSFKKVLPKENILPNGYPDVRCQESPYIHLHLQA